MSHPSSGVYDISHQLPFHPEFFPDDFLICPCVSLYPSFLPFLGLFGFWLGCHPQSAVHAGVQNCVEGIGRCLGHYSILYLLQLSVS